MIRFASTHAHSNSEGEGEVDNKQITRRHYSYIIIYRTWNIDTMVVFAGQKLEFLNEFQNDKTQREWRETDVA